MPPAPRVKAVDVLTRFSQDGLSPQSPGMNGGSSEKEELGSAEGTAQETSLRSRCVTVTAMSLGREGMVNPFSSLPFKRFQLSVLQ